MFFRWLKLYLNTTLELLYFHNQSMNIKLNIIIFICFNEFVFYHMISYFIDSILCYQAFFLPNLTLFLMQNNKLTKVGMVNNMTTVTNS